MIETELKFQVPASQVSRLRRALATAGARAQALDAVYVDTADRALAGARIALRLRREGAQWVQTAKAAGEGLADRLEHEVRLPGRRAPQGVRLELHDAHPALAAALRRALGEPPAALQPRHRIEVRRTVRKVRAGGAVVEVALDEGSIRAGEHELPVREVEFELVSGDRAALVALAADWARRYRLWLDPRSKAERGERLAQGLDAVPAVKARPPALGRRMPAERALAAMVDACLRQVLGNAAEIADGLGRPEHVHQLRVGLRRLRSVLRTFGDWAPDPAAAVALEQALRPLFSTLGTQRDLDVVTHLLAGPLHAGGHELPAAPEAASGTDPADVVRGPAFAAAVLQALALAWSVPSGEGAPDDAPPPDLRRPARRALARLWKRIDADAGQFAAIEEEQRHDLRKRAKRLRYALDFAAPLWPRRRVVAFLAALAEAQDAIGAYNDMVTAQALLRAMDAQHPAVAYAAGWVASQRQDRLRDCERPLRRLAKADRPWE